MGNAQYGRLNPFHIITALDDDEAGENGPSGSYATHLQFLEEFFRQIMPDCGKDAMEYLNTLVDHMYLSRDITGDTDLSRLTPQDYPVFDDLYDEVLQEFQSSDNPFTRDLLRSLMNYIAKFSSGGRNANIWNGPSTVTTDENFTVFNFQSMLANRNQTIANAQMLLVLKYIDNEIIKNRDYNIRNHANRKIVVVIDEAHVFIDAKYPIALDFMFQLAKRIRKYNGMQIVITQNIKDFVGSEELARKSTAIINACQYSFIFALAPNDMQDLVLLYEKAGGINESEQEQIVQAPRGQAFTIMSPTSRSSFRVQTSPGITEMFQQSSHVSRYFTGEQGARNWEDFVGIHRQAHDAAAAAQGRREISGLLPEESQWSGSGVTLNVFEEDEYEDYARENSGVSLNMSDEDDDDFWSGAKPDTAAAPKEAERPAQAAAVGLGGMAASQTDVFSRIASALGRMADAAERGEGSAPAMLGSMLQQSAAGAYPTAAESERERQLREKEEELLRMQAELEEKLRMLRAEAAQGTGAYEEASGAEDFGPFSEEDDDSYSDEADGELSVLFDDNSGLFAADDDDEEDDGGNDDFRTGEDGYLDEDVPDDVGFFSDDDEEEEEDEDEDEEEEEGEDSDDDFMASFCSFAESLMKMSPFEKMQANGSTVAEITLDDLNREIEARAEKMRKIRSGSY